jgi:hypothetical protein
VTCVLISSHDPIDLMWRPSRALYVKETPCISADKENMLLLTFHTDENSSVI